MPITYTDAFIIWVKSEANKVNSDGCSKVPDFHKVCCLIHDLAYYYAKNPFIAYSCYLEGYYDYWDAAPTINQKDADGYIKTCIQSRSKLGWFSPMAWWRYGILRLVGKKAWNSHKSTHSDPEPEEVL